VRGDTVRRQHSTFAQTIQHSCIKWASYQCLRPVRVPEHVGQRETSSWRVTKVNLQVRHSGYWLLKSVGGYWEVRKRPAAKSKSSWFIDDEYNKRYYKCRLEGVKQIHRKELKMSDLSDCPVQVLDIVCDSCAKMCSKCQPDLARSSRPTSKAFWHLIITVKQTQLLSSRLSEGCLCFVAISNNP